MNNNIDDKLIKAYVWNGYEDFTSKNFNLYAFWLSLFYIAYRKVYTVAIILWGIGFALGIGTGFISDTTIASVIIYAYVGLLMLFFGFKFNGMYINYVKKAVEKIKLENPNATEEQLCDICAKKGKPSILVPIIIIVVGAIITAGLRTIIGE